LLDVVLTLAENIKLLIMGPLIAGFFALGIGFMLAPTYQSISVLQADQATASLMLTASVLDPVIANLGLAKEQTLEDTRRQLRGHIKAVVGRNDKLLTLTVSARTAQQSQAIANAVLQKTYQESRPKGTAKTRLQTQLEEAQARLKNTQLAAAGLLKRLESNRLGAADGSAEVARGYAELLSAAGAAQTQISALEAQLEGLSDAQLLQPPTLPEKASEPKKALVTVGATLATALALLLFIFLRQAVHNTASNSTTSEKWARIRHSLGLK
jgi:hypothetical protein